MTNHRDVARLTPFIRELDRLSRIVFLLRYADGLSAEEIGAVTDLAPGEVERRLASLRHGAEARLGRLQLAV